MGSKRVPTISAARGIPSQVKQSTASPSLKAVDLAAVNINEDFKAPTIKVDNDILNADLKCMPIQHIKAKLPHSMWDMHEKSSEKGNALGKAKAKGKEEYRGPVLLTVAPQNIQPFAFGVDQRRQPGPFKSEVPSVNKVGSKNANLQKTAIYLIDQEGSMKVGEELNQEFVLSSNMHTLQMERQNNEFKASWETNPESFPLQNKQETRNISGPIWSSYAKDSTNAEIVRQEDKMKTSDVDSTICTKQVKPKAKKIRVPLLLGQRHGSNEEEPGDNIQHQNSFHLRKHGENVVLKASLDLRHSKVY